MPLFDHDDAVGDAVSQQVFQRPGHGRPGFAGPNDQDTVEIFKGEAVFSHLQRIIN